MSTVTVKMRVKPDRESEFLNIFKQVAAIVETQEPDCLIYAVWETGIAHEYFLVESYRSEAARTLHEAMHSKVAAAFFDCLEGKPETVTLGKQVLGIPG